MDRNLKPWSPLDLRLLAVLCLVACPRIGATAGAWSVVSLPQQPGEVMSPFLVAVDGAGSLYVADYSDGTPWSASTRIQKRDPRRHWSVRATYGTGLGQVDDPIALAADAAGNLYVLDGSTGR